MLSGQNEEVRLEGGIQTGCTGHPGMRIQAPCRYPHVVGSKKLQYEEENGERHSITWRAGGIKGAARIREVDANEARRGHEDIRWVARPVPRASARGSHHTGARAKAWCLSIHAKASLSLSLSLIDIYGVMP